MKTLALGVLGHVDHGKTSLVRALTGIDTDRLPEEKARGMSIVPGYAWLDVPGGCIELIDVPGHRDFVRNMAAGACGIEAALIVVDGGEGVREQTREHLEIARLLGVRRGVLALTKCDRAAGSPEAVKQALAGMGFDVAAVCTSAVTGQGLAELKQRLAELLAAIPAARPKEAFYLPIDRVFTLAGHGAVVTGTLRAGPLARGDEVEVMPCGMRAMVRQLEVHARAVERAAPGQRVGVNLRGVKREALERGGVLCTPGMISAASQFDAMLSGALPRAGEALQLLIHTAAAAARVRAIGESFVRIRTERPVCALPGEPFILRRAGATVGGGRVLDPSPARKTGAGRLARIAELLQKEKLLLPREMPAEGPSSAELELRLLRGLEAFHASHPTREGASLPWCRACAGDDLILEALERKGAIVICGDTVRLAGFDALGALSDAERRLAREIENAFRDGGMQPPGVQEVIRGDRRRDDLCRLLLSRGRLVRAGPVVFHRDAIAGVRERLAAAFPPPAQFTVSQARELVGSTRKYVVPLLEFLDASRHTRRAGDLRSLRTQQ